MSLASQATLADLSTKFDGRIPGKLLEVYEVKFLFIVFCVTLWGHSVLCHYLIFVHVLYSPYSLLR